MECDSRIEASRERYEDGNNRDGRRFDESSTAESPLGGAPIPSAEEDAQDVSDEEIMSNPLVAVDVLEAEEPPDPKASLRENISVYAAIIGNILVGIVKFIAAGISGSTAMVSEGIHSIVDSGNGLLVLYGIHASKKKPDLLHPFGYGKNVYFFSFIVALMIFALGGGISMFKGITAFQNPAAELGDPTLNYIVIIIAAIIEGTSLTVAIRQINRERGSKSLRKFVRDGKDPSHFTVLLEDSAAEAGLIAAFCGVFFSNLLNDPRIDAVASMVIGLILFAVAAILLRETQGLLIGEGLEARELEDLIDLVEEDADVERCGRVLSMYIGPNDMLLTLDIAFNPKASEVDVMRSIDRIESSIVSRYPQANRIFIEAESLRICASQSRGIEEMIDQAEREEEKL